MARGKGLDMKDDDFEKKAAELQAEQDAQRAEAEAAAQRAAGTQELAVATEDIQGRVLERVQAEGQLVAQSQSNAIIRELLETDYDDSDERAAETEAAILTRILNTPEDEDVFMPPEAVKIDDLSRQQIVVKDFHINKSDIAEGPGWYLAIDITIVESKEEAVLVTGVKRIIAQVWQAKLRNKLPAEVWVRPSNRPNRHNRFMHYLDARHPNDWR